MLMSSATTNIAAAITMRARWVIRQRGTVETDRAGNRHTGYEQQHDDKAHGAGELGDCGDDVTVDDRRPDHGAEDHRQYATERRAPVAGPESLAGAGVRWQIARIVGHVRRIAELPERAH